MLCVPFELLFLHELCLAPSLLPLSLTKEKDTFLHLLDISSNATTTATGKTERLTGNGPDIPREICLSLDRKPISPPQYFELGRPSSPLTGNRDTLTDQRLSA